jgi:hypothetical protein
MNELILAHGIRPIAEPEYIKMEGITRELLIALFSKEADDKLNEVKRSFNH